MDNIEPAKINIASVQDIKTLLFVSDLIQEVDIMNCSVCKVYKGGEIGLDIELGMYPHRCFGLSELCPPKYTQAQINSGRINGIYIAFCVHFQFIAPFAQHTGFSNQHIGVVCEDP